MGAAGGLGDGLRGGLRGRFGTYKVGSLHCRTFKSHRQKKINCAGVGREVVFSNMADAKTTELFNCSIQEFYNIISDYEKYSEFLSEVKSCKVLRTESSRKLVEYTVTVVKDFKYRLWMTEEPPNKVSWVLESGDLFKVSNGYWELQDEAGKTRATYYVDAKFNMFVPGPIAKALVNVNLPNMVSSYHKRVKELYGK